MDEEIRKKRNIQRRRKRKIKRLLIILAMCMALAMGVYQYVRPVEVLCATDGGSVLYVGRFYELMKVKAMTSEDGEYYVGYRLEINGEKVYDKVELKKLY